MRHPGAFDFRVASSLECHSPWSRYVIFTMRLSFPGTLRPRSFAFPFGLPKNGRPVRLRVIASRLLPVYISDSSVYTHFPCQLQYSVQTSAVPTTKQMAARRLLYQIVRPYPSAAGRLERRYVTHQKPASIDRRLNVPTVGENRHDKFVFQCQR